MNNSQENKFKVIEDRDIIVGIDIAKNVHWGVIISPKGNILMKSFSFNNTSKGIESLVANINKILIYECIYMFIKATIISIILSIPILYGIIKYIENIIILNKLLIPFGSIFIFFVIILLISLAVTLYSTRIIKDK